MHQSEETLSTQLNKPNDEHQKLEVPANEGVKSRKSLMDKKKRQSLIRKRRSSSMGFHLGVATDNCDLTTLNQPPQKRLHSLLQQSLLFSLDKSCNEILDPAVAVKVKSSVQVQLEDFLNDLMTQKIMREEHMQSKEKESLNPDVVEYLKRAEDYIEKLKTESSQWDRLLHKFKEERQWPTKLNEVVPSEVELDHIQKTSVIHVHSKKLATHHDRLRLQITTIVEAVISLKTFSEQVQHDLFHTVHKLNTEANDGLSLAEEKKFLKLQLS